MSHNKIEENGLYQDYPESKLCPDYKEFNHIMIFQLYDGNDFPVEGTQFSITLKIIKFGNQVTIKFPVVNFQVGPIATNDIYGPLPGGKIRTSEGFLPECIRPADTLYQSFSVPTNDGLSLIFSYTTPLNQLPVPIPGYILGISLDGRIIIAGGGQFIGLIPVGSHTLPPTTVIYVVEKSEKLCKNQQISTGATDITQFSPLVGGFSYRATHINDAFDNVLAWSWEDNSMIADKTNGIMNLMVAIGKVSKKTGKLKIRTPIQLTNITTPNNFAWDSAVAINRKNKKNIIASWEIITNVTTPNYLTGQIYRAVSFDGGKSWPINGLVNIQPTGVPQLSGETRGVAFDKYGNIWYVYANYADNEGNIFNKPIVAVSVDEGYTFQNVYNGLPLYNLGYDSYDTVAFSFGGDGQGGYGLWLTVDYYSYQLVTENFIGIIPVIVFIPILGFNNFGSGSYIFLDDQLDTQYLADIAASQDGRMWISSAVAPPNSVVPTVVRFKSPGPLDANYCGVWQTGMISELQFYSDSPFATVSYPNFFYYNTSRTVIYDDKRQALYILNANNVPDQSQNMRIFLLISRNNGQSWSKPIYISTSNFGNRGFPSMALDTVTGNLVFGWYDGRNDPTLKSLVYEGAVLLAKTLDEVISAIPLTNPLYSIPPSPKSNLEKKDTPEQSKIKTLKNPRIIRHLEMIKKRHELIKVKQASK